MWFAFSGEHTHFKGIADIERPHISFLMEKSSYITFGASLEGKLSNR